MQKTTREKKEEYKSLRKNYLDGEISKDEFAESTDELLSDGDDFLNHEQTTSDKLGRAAGLIRAKLSYYSLPLVVIGVFCLVIAAPFINPILSIVLAPTLFALGMLLWIYQKI